jgi:hypothetical protein
MATHATALVSARSESSMDLTDSMGPIEERLKRSLNLLDGVNYVAYSLWPLPLATRSVGDLRTTDISVYIQSAGTASAMTVEMRDEKGGTVHHYSVGRKDDPHGSDPAVDIKWGDSNVWVFPNEVFGAAEAAEIYYFYYLHGTIPPQYDLRPL